MGSSRPVNTTAPPMTDSTSGLASASPAVTSAATRSTARPTSCSEHPRSASRSICQARFLSSIGPGLLRFGRQRIEKGGKIVADLGMTQRVQHVRLKVAELGSAVVARALELVCQRALLVEERGNAVGQLDLAARSRSDLLEVTEDLRRQYVAPYHRKIGWRILRPRLLD